MVRIAPASQPRSSLPSSSAARRRVPSSGAAAEGGARALHQPGLLVLPAGRCALRRARARDPDVIALTLPVTYWDYLGWKDTLGTGQFHQAPEALRQGARRRPGLHAAGGASTAPSHVVGSDKAELERAVKDQAASGASPATVSLEEEAGTLRIKLTPADGGRREDRRRLGAADRRAWSWCRSRAARTRARPGLLRQCRARHGPRRRLGRHGNDSDGPARLDPGAGGADGYVVIVQADQPSKYGMMPGTILGAARAKR